MNIDYVARNFQLDERLRQYTEEKLAKVAKFLDEPIEVKVELGSEKFRYSCDLAISHRHGDLYTSVEGHEVLEAISAAIEAVVEQAKRGRKKHTDQKRRTARSSEVELHWPLEVVESASVGRAPAPRILETTRLPIKPMTLEEAAEQLADSEQGFVVFRDAANDKVSVLYRRKDNNFGLLAPEF